MILYLVHPIWAQSIPAQDILRDTMMRECRKNFPGAISFFHTSISPFDVSHTPLFYLGQSLMDLAQADAAVFCHDWQNYRDCATIHELVQRFGKPFHELDRLEWAWDEKTHTFKNQRKSV